MKRLPMKTHDSARRTLGRIIKAYHAGEMESKEFRDLIYGFSALLAYFRLDTELRIEKQMAEVREMIEEGFGNEIRKRA